MSPGALERLNAALSGRYRVERELGEGGMATVYLADDLKHERRVALKVLKPELAAVVGAERFLAEIKTTASLQHPHILPLFDSGEADGFLFYVMPYVEGETLRERISRERQLPVEEALRITTALAEALQHAHDRGVIHRDIKPANLLLQGGQPVIADFGIALAVGAAGGSRLTETGLSVGTPYYMSPEQATGDQVVGPASDIYALAAVLYEMLVGDPPYIGSTAQAVLGKILQGAPVSATQIRRSVPRNVDAAIRKALEKLPADRFAGARDFAHALSDPGFRYGEGAELGAAAARGPWNRLTVAMTVVALTATLAAAWSWTRPGPMPAPVARFESPFREGQVPVGPFTLTPDGSAIVYVGAGEGGQGSRLWIRRWDDPEARPIPGTDGARAGLDGAEHAVSPDGRDVAFVAGGPGPLRVASLGGSPPRTLVESAWSAAWSGDGWLYFMRGADFGLSRIRPDGSAAETLTEPSDGEVYHGFPRPLPGGEAILFQVWHSGDGSDAEIWSLDLQTRERRVVTPGNNPRYVTSGHLLYGTPDGTLMAARFDPRRVELTGAAIPMIQGVYTTPARGNVSYTISGDGTLAFLAGGGVTSEYELVWVARSGEVTPVDRGETFVPSPQGNDGWRLSPDGTRIAFTRNVDGNDDIWIKRLPQGAVSRLTFSPEMDLLPQWTPDGRSVTYRNGPLAGGYLWRVPADGTGEATLLFDGLAAAQGVWSPDGEWLVVRRAGVVGDESARDIVAIRPGVDSIAIPLVATREFWEQAPAISRDGRWLAYSSNETGRHEIYVRPFPAVGDGKWQVSTDGGVNPVWAHNGRELFFLNPESRELQAAEFTATGPTWQVGGITALFEVPATFFFNSNGNSDLYDVDLDDERFLMARQYGVEDEAPSVVLVQSFFEELRRLVPD